MPRRKRKRRKSTAVQTHPPGSRYSDLEIERALTALALEGNSRRAAEHLKETQGWEIDHTTIYRWARDRYPDRYRRIVQEVLPAKYERIAEEQEAFALRSIDVQNEYLDKAREEMPNVRADQLSGAVRNFGVSIAIALDKAQVIRGKPTAITEERSVPELLRILSQPKFASALPGLKDSPLLQTLDAENVEEVPDDEIPNQEEPAR